MRFDSNVERIERVFQPGEPITQDILDAVADAVATVPNELPPLTGSIDPDALEDLFDGARDGNVSISFTYAGSRVTVLQDGIIFVTPLGEETPL